MCVQYRGEYLEYRGGVQCRGGIMSTVGVLSTVEDIMMRVKENNVCPFVPHDKFAEL